MFPSRSKFRPQHFEQSVGKRWGFEYRGKQQQATARVLMLGRGKQRTTKLGIAAETLRARDQPQIELVFIRAPIERPRFGEQLCVVALRVVDQVAGMHLEEACQQQPGGVGQVRARAALDLREVGLADRRVHLLANGAHQFLLRHGAVESAEGAFDFAEVADFLAEFHIAIRNNNIAICNKSK